MPAEDLVPEGQVALHVPHLGEALAVGGIGGSPASERLHIEILAIDVDTLARDQPVDRFHDPLPRLGMPQVKQPSPAALQDPLGMLHGQP